MKNRVKAKDSPAFIINHLVLPVLNEAVQLVFEEKKTAMEDVDKAVTCMDFPAGPFRLA